MKKTYLISIILAVIMLITTSIPANAISPTYQDTFYNILYCCNCECAANFATVNSTTRAATVSGQPVAQNYMMMLATLFNQNGTLVSSSGTRYNHVVTNSMSVWCVSTVAGTYEAHGMALFFNGTISDQGYYEYDGYLMIDPDLQTFPLPTSPTPDICCQVSKIYRYNDRGETFGSAKNSSSYEEYPDWIETLGSNGHIGYVRKNDLIHIPTSFEDAEAYSAIVDNTTIPVYDFEGSVIDTFAFSGSCEYGI